MLRAREGAQEGGSAEAGDAFEQNLTAREQAGENAIDHAGLPDDDFADFRTYFVEFATAGLIAASVPFTDGRVWVLTNARFRAAGCGLQNEANFAGLGVMGFLQNEANGRIRGSAV